MLTAILVVVIFFLAVALALAFVEAKGGTFGDTSFIPGWLILGVVVVIIMCVVGGYTGHFGIWIK